MNIMIVGASGMVGRGVLNVCLRSPDVKKIYLLVRRRLANVNFTRVQQIEVADFMQFQAELELQQLDACFFCAGASSFGMSEEDYRKMTFDLTLHVAEQLGGLNPELNFIYISGVGADSSEQSHTMWKRVRGQTENALLGLPLHATIFRPAFILAEKGIKSKTAIYEAMYTIMRPLVAILQKITPISPLTTADIGNAMLNAVRQQSVNGKVLEAKAIKALARK